MINSHEIADAVFDEIDIHIRACAEFKITDEQSARAIMIGHNPLPPRSAVSWVIEESYWASLLTEEGRNCRFRLSYCDPNGESNSSSAYLLETAHRLGTPLTLHKSNLRRLSHAHDYKHGDLLWSIISGIPSIIGLRIPKYDGESLGFRIAVTGPGQLVVSCFQARMLIFNRGDIVRKSQTGMRSFSTINALISFALGGNPKRDPLVHLLLDKMLEQGHGGSIWMLPEGSQLKDHLDHLSPNYVIEGSPSIIKNDRHEKDSRQWIHSLARFAGVDGAVLIDADLRALAFGVFVDTSGNHGALKWADSDNTVPIKGDEIGGGRHRAAVAFCRHNSPAAAVVLSQDGRVTVVAAPACGIPQMSEVYPMNAPDILAILKYDNIENYLNTIQAVQSYSLGHTERDCKYETPQPDEHNEPILDGDRDRIGREGSDPADCTKVDGTDLEPPRSA